MKLNTFPARNSQIGVTPHLEMPGGIIFIAVVLIVLSACAPLKNGCMQSVSPPHATCGSEENRNLSTVKK